MLKIETQTGLTDFAFNDANFLIRYLEDFEKIIDDKNIGFFHLTSDHSILAKTRLIYEKFAHKKHFFHIGIGGSALGPQMLCDSLGHPNKVTMTFLDNIDPDDAQTKFDQIKNPSDVLFYVVSKSGSTAETIAGLILAQNWLLKHNVKNSDFKNYFVFCTDPVQSDLKELANEQNIAILDLPSNVGGRFSILTPAGLLPALFCGANIEKIYAGANGLKPSLLSRDVDNNPLLQCFSHLAHLYKYENIDQTVMMPYSSNLKTFGQWFVQLWAESLGKIHPKTLKNIGFTPIPAFGATDQHSQMQLFMQGPRNKCLLLIQVENFAHSQSLSNTIGLKSFTRLKNHSLGDLMQAELDGTKQALQEENRPFICMQINKVDEESIGSLILLFESLTALMGHFLEIDPFNQPGVEKGKIYSYEYLNKGK